MTANGTYAKLLNILAVVAFAGILLFFLPLTQNFYASAKFLLLCLAFASVLAVVAVRLITENRISLLLTHTSAAAFGLALFTIPGLFIATKNIPEAAVSLYGPLALAVFALVLILAASPSGEFAKKLYTRSLFAVMGIMGLIAVYESFGLGKVVFSAVPWLADPLWSPAGTPSGTLAVLIIPLPLLVASAVRAFKNERETETAFLGVTLALVVAGIVGMLWHWIGQYSRTVLPLQYGWAVALDVFKRWPDMAVGVGTENFFPAFTAGRPPAMNTTPVWNTSFGENASLLLHWVTIFGGLGLLGILFFLRRAWKVLEGSSETVVTALLALIFFALLPPSVVLYPLILFILLLSDKGTPTERKMQQLPAIGLALIIFILLAVGLYGTLRWWSGERFFYRSLTTTSTNGTDIYMLQNRAIRENPYVGRYYIAFSQTNLSMAAALIDEASQARATGSAAILPEETKLLVSQSVETAIKATRLAPNNVFSWMNLAAIYSALLGKAKDSDTWAVASLQKAVTLDPSNPAIRVNLGDIYFLLKRYDEAHQQYLTATALKANYIPARYALARVLKAKGLNKEALSLLTELVSLVPPGSPELLKIQSEIAELQQKVPKADIPRPSSPATEIPDLVLPQ